MDVVAYQGEAGAYSEEGALALFPEAERLAFPSVRKVFEAVEVGRVAAGLVPLDNSQAGSINETYDLFLRHGLHLVGETVVRVDHCLLALPGSTIDDLREVLSHPQANAQPQSHPAARRSCTGSRCSPTGSRRTRTTTRASAPSPATRRPSPSRTSRPSSSESATSPARCTAVSGRSPSAT